MSRGSAVRPNRLRFSRLLGPSVATFSFSRRQISLGNATSPSSSNVMQWIVFFSFATTRFSGVRIIIFNSALMRQSCSALTPMADSADSIFFLDAARFRIVCVYVPAQPSHSKAFYKNLDVHLLDARHCLVLGDFNCVVDSRRDVREPGHGRSTWNAREFRRLIGHFDLVDCWTLLHGATFEHTWQRGRSSSRLDRVYVTETLASAVQACGAVDFPPAIGHVSDHRPVLAKLSL
ncbi:unnamed protein product, partial [Ixodes persulcatus]